MIFDRQGKVLGCNPAAERLLDRSLAELQAMELDDWHRISTDGRRLTPGEFPLTQTLRSGVAQREVQVGYVSPSGTPSWFQINVEPVLDQGTVTGAVVSFTDITEKR